ncbi:hypothetical protein [Nocardioides sp. Soil805]|uniref:hypothetical protein n=1 Tax=Nocardioides sp. Soil805 TaxID=1736416 RepID=UPI00070354DA|nr:hypothetical protein [Nocardioides sp. Soil805]KRF34231.1 hypothetical protein ASG94_16040 [Nocardioides sp. Soil805]
MTITLREITEDNAESVLALRSTPQQEKFVSTVDYSLTVELVRDHGGTELLTSHVPGEGGPAGFYARLGFTPTGEVDADGEILLRRTVHG